MQTQKQFWSKTISLPTILYCAPKLTAAMWQATVTYNSVFSTGFSWLQVGTSGFEFTSSEKSIIKLHFNYKTTFFFHHGDLQFNLSLFLPKTRLPGLIICSCNHYLRFLWNVFFPMCPQCKLEGVEFSVYPPSFTKQSFSVRAKPCHMWLVILNFQA